MVRKEAQARPQPTPYYLALTGLVIEVSESSVWSDSGLPGRSDGGDRGVASGCLRATRVDPGSKQSVFLCLPPIASAPVLAGHSRFAP